MKGPSRFWQLFPTQRPARRLLRRVRDAVRQDDVVGVDASSRSVARLGGDEFSVLLPAIEPSGAAAYVARRIIETLEASFNVEGQEVFLTASIGVATYPEDGEDSDTLMKNAAVATEYAKRRSRGTFQFYSNDLDAESREMFELETDLRHALERDEFELYYQPKIDAVSNEVVGMEGLLRWHHETRGMVPPGIFIPIAEESGMIGPIGEWILRDACATNQRLRASGYPGLKVSINVSALQLTDGKLGGIVAAALRESGLTPDGLIVEITESVMMGDVESNLSVLGGLRDLGVKLSVDDFGTGYSSLGYLKRLPISELKIDKSFVDDVPGASEDVAIVRAIMALAHALELTVTAEGVETERQLEFLTSINCDLIQGYLYSKPLPLAEFESYLRTQSVSGA